MYISGTLIDGRVGDVSRVGRIRLRSSIAVVGLTRATFIFYFYILHVLKFPTTPTIHTLTKHSGRLIRRSRLHLGPVDSP